MWAQAALWGGVAGSALLVGAALGYEANIPRRVIAGVMAFGAGVLISALAFDLMDEAFRSGGFDATSVGFIAGAIIYTGSTLLVNHRGAKRRKRSHSQPSESANPGSGLVLAIGALIDGIPESVAIGVSMIHGGAVSTVAVAAVFLSNVPEGLSSAAGVGRPGRSPGDGVGRRGGDPALSAFAPPLCESVFNGLFPHLIARAIAPPGR